MVNIRERYYKYEGECSTDMSVHPIEFQYTNPSSDGSSTLRVSNGRKNVVHEVQNLDSLPSEDYELRTFSEAQGF